MCELGLSREWSMCSASSDWDQVVRANAERVHVLKQQELIHSQVSLNFYRQLGQSFVDGVHPYLDDRFNLRGTRLKLALRNGTLMLMTRVASVLGWPEGGGQCLLCRDGSLETAEHFLAVCPFLSLQREKLKQVLHQSLSFAGMPGASLFSFFASATRTDQARLVAGWRVVLPCLQGHALSTEEREQHVDLRAKALWLLDKASKNFILGCWKARSCRLGKITVRDGQLVHELPVVLQGLPEPRLGTVLREQGVEIRQLWSGWRVELKSLRKHRVSKRSCFYVVSGGSLRTGALFYRWCDAAAFVSRVPGSSVRGFSSLDDAVSFRCR